MKNLLVDYKNEATNTNPNKPMRYIVIGTNNMVWFFFILIFLFIYRGMTDNN
jgi:hypothetical protein